MCRPLDDGVIELAGRGHLPGGSKRNMEAIASTVDYGRWDRPLREILPMPKPRAGSSSRYIPIVSSS